MKMKSYHALLLLLACLARRQFRLLCGFNLVAHRIKLLLITVIGTLESRTISLTLHPVVTGWGHLAIKDSPDFRGDGFSELGIV